MTTIQGAGYIRLEEIQILVSGSRLRLAFFVTALPLELAAVRAHITNLGGIRARDGTILECGRFSDRGQEWLIVIGETGAGTHNAQQVVSCGHTTFMQVGKFELMIFIGVGGSRKKGAPIGSVVAADKIYYPYGGKYTGGILASRPASVPMDHELINIARKVIRDEVWPSRIIAFRNGPKPGESTYPVSMPPIAKVAPIASIEAVLDDPESELEELLKNSYSDTHVVEMEGYGAVFSAHTERTPGMIVRGVSDMTNHKSEDDDEVFQPLAASHAAAFAFEMLVHWGMHNDPPPSSSLHAVTRSGPLAEKVLPVSDPMSAESGTTPTPPSAARNSEVSPDSDRPDDIEFAATRVEISIVLNIRSDFRPDDLERLDQLQNTLRELSGSQKIEIVRAVAGSLVIFISDPDSALSKVGERRLKETLLEAERLVLIGMTPISAYEARNGRFAELNAASAELLSWQSTLPDGEHLERPELGVLIARITENVSSTSALIGPPGAGKSALLATLGNYFRNAGWPVLAIKADLLDPDIASETDLRERLGLSVSPSAILREMAEFGPVLLIIDQLDALAGYLDIKTARLSILLNLVRRFGQVDNVHVVISSRVFEFQHDVRLKAVNAESVMLELPPWSEVLSVLESRGIAAAGWPEDAKEVMRSPQALAIYLQLNTKNASESFASYQLMLEKLWQERVLSSADAGERERLASEIAETMALHESLWIAAARFANHTAAMQALIAAGILVALHSSIGFSHQTLFEFSLARSFSQEIGRLSNFAIERQDSLFLRPKLWAGLTYLRGADRDLYHHELESIWRTQGLRAHLRVLIIDFLGSQSQPSDREALVMETALADSTTSLRAFGALAGSQGWFARLASNKIPQAMGQGGAVANAQVNVLTRALHIAPDRVIRLIKDYWLPDSINDLRSWAVIEELSRWTDDALSIGLAIIERTNLSNSAVDRVASSIAVEQPEVALRLVRSQLDRDLTKAIAESEARRATAPSMESMSEDEKFALRLSEGRSPLRNLLESSNDWDSLFGIAEKWPLEVLNALCPWFIACLDAIKRFTDPPEYWFGYPLRVEADFRFESEDGLDLPEPSILAALRISVEGISKSDPNSFRAWVSESGSIELTPIQRLIAHGMAHQGHEYAKDGLDFILDDERRYFLGSYRDLRGTTKRLIVEVSPYWLPDQVKAFEHRVRLFSPLPPLNEMDPKQRQNWRNVVRRTQLDLLRSLPEHQRSPAVARQVIEEERRYGQERPEVSFSGVRSIGPVLGADGMAKARNDDIVNAFVELPDETGWDNPKKWMAGGNIQLARAFATFAREHAERAVQIISRLNYSNGTRAAAYTIEALAETGSPEKVVALLRDVVSRGFDSEEFRQSVARGLERIAKSGVNIDEDLICLLEDWVRENAVALDWDDSHKGETPEDEEIDGPVGDGRSADALEQSLLWGYGGTFIVPGGNVPLASAVVHIRLLRGEADKAVEFLLEYLDQEKRSDAWMTLLDYFHYFYKADPGRRELLLDRVFSEVKGVVGGLPFARFLARSQNNDHPFVERHIDAWRHAESNSARQAYGEIVALDSLIRPHHFLSVARLEEIMHDAKATYAQTGAYLSAAHVFVENVERRGNAAALLIRALMSNDLKVWRAISELFRIADELQVDNPTRDLLRAVADGLPHSADLDATFIVDRLATLLPHEALLVGEIAHNLVTKWEAELGDFRTATSMAASALVDLAITLHRLGPETREVGLNLFERLINLDAYSARQTLDEIDNRFRQTAPVARRRVRRRSEVAPRKRRHYP